MHEESSPVNGQCSVGVMRGVAGSRPFKKKLNYLENYYRRTVKYFSMIPFASSRQ